MGSVMMEMVVHRALPMGMLMGMDLGELESVMVEMVMHWALRMGMLMGMDLGALE